MDTRVKAAYDEFTQLSRLPLFFVLSKTLGYLLLPTNFLIAIGFVGAILMVTRFASLGRKLVIAAVLLLVICGLSPLGKALLYPLEARFPPWDAARGAPDGIIVLGASIEADLSVAHGTPVVRGAPDRIIAAAALARRYPNARVVFSGGSANLVSNDAREADFAGAIFESLGVDKSRLIMERAIAQHPGECRILQGAGQAEGRRTMGAGDLGLSYAAVGRLVPKSGICGRALSRRLAGRRTR